MEPNHDIHDDVSRHDAPTPADTSRPTQDISQFTLSVEEAREQFKAAGFRMKPRTVQRWCRFGTKLSCVKIHRETREPVNIDDPNGIFLVDPTSLSERIEQLRDKADLAPEISDDSDASGRNQSRQDASGRDETQPNNESQQTEEVVALERKLERAEFEKEVSYRLVEEIGYLRATIAKPSSCPNRLWTVPCR